MKRWFLILLACLALASCDFAESIAELQAQANAASGMLKHKFGAEPGISWRISNGAMLVTVTFDADDISKVTVDELRKGVRQAIGTAFDDAPETVVLYIDVSE